MIQKIKIEAGLAEKETAGASLSSYAICDNVILRFSPLYYIVTISSILSGMTTMRDFGDALHI